MRYKKVLKINGLSIYFNNVQIDDSLGKIGFYNNNIIILVVPGTKLKCVNVHELYNTDLKFIDFEVM